MSTVKIKTQKEECLESSNELNEPNQISHSRSDLKISSINSAGDVRNIVICAAEYRSEHTEDSGASILYEAKKSQSKNVFNEEYQVTGDNLKSISRTTSQSKSLDEHHKNEKEVKEDLKVTEDFKHEPVPLPIRLTRSQSRRTLEDQDYKTNVIKECEAIDSWLATPVDSVITSVESKGKTKSQLRKRRIHPTKAGRAKKRKH